MLLILNQSPRARIYRFRNLFLITLKREKNSSTSFWIDPGSTLSSLPKIFSWVDPKISKKNFV